TSGEFSRRCSPGVLGVTDASRYVGRGSALPFAAIGSKRAAVTPPLAGRALASAVGHAADGPGGARPAPGLKDAARARELAGGRPWGRVAGDDLARVVSGARPDLDPPLALELDGERREVLLHLERGTDGAARVVLVKHRDPEGGHDGVADELLDRTAVPLDD